MPVSHRLPRARLSWAALAVLVLAVLAGCTLKSGGYNTTSPPKLRFFNASADIGAIDVAVGGTQAINLLSYETYSSYRPTAIGPQPITVTLSGSTTQVLETTQDFENGNRFSYVFYGRPSAPAALLLADNVDVPGGGSVKLRFANVATEQGPLDLYITNPGESLDNASPFISGVGLGSATGYIDRGSGSAEIRITPSGSKTVLYDSGQITLSERNSYAIVAYSRGDPNQVNVGLLTMDTLGSGAALNSIVAATRVVNAAPGDAAVNAGLPNNVTISGVAYGTASPYQIVTSGTQTVNFANAATPGTNLVSGTVLLPPGGDATMVLYGNAGAEHAISLQDFNYLPTTPGNARVRVVNVGSDVGSVTTLVNGTLTVGALINGSPSLYFELPASTYLFSFVDSASSASLLDVPNVALAAGHTYTLFLIGPAGHLGYLLTQDR